jgi:hypothetical protein
VGFVVVRHSERPELREGIDAVSDLGRDPGSGT